jgi:molybdate transport system regulatory protein
MTPHLKLRAQILSDSEIAFGPGKADLLDAIARTGSISAAARDMNMSYRRAWLLVDAMNRCFREPLVKAGRGGAEHGGAEVTAFGRSILKRYRSLQNTLETVAARHVEKLVAELRS